MTAPTPLRTSPGSYRRQTVDDKGLPINAARRCARQSADRLQKPRSGDRSYIVMRHGRQVRGFSLRENAFVRGANGHVQRQPAQRMLRGVTQPPKAVRRGWTLVEMLVVVTIVSILLATVAVTIQTIMRQQRSFAQGITEQRTLALLARQIRADVHAAARVEMVAARAAIGDGKKAASDAVATSAIRCSGPLGRSVRYTLHNGQLLRVVHEPGEKAARRQAFSLPRGAAIRLVEPAEAKSPIATIQLDYPAGHTAMEARLGDVARRKLIIEALIGSDLRWQKPGQAPAPTDPSAEAVP